MRAAHVECATPVGGYDRSVTSILRKTSLAGAVAVGLLAAGCGASAPVSGAPAPAALSAALRGSPPALAALHTQADQLLGGGTDAFRTRLARLRGYPVVVNAWASWCQPCREEFPLLQSAAARLGRRVAFLGVDVSDGPAAARRFLRSFPVSYPSYMDPDSRIARSLGPAFGVPITAFIDRAGHHAYLHQGAYRDERALLADVNRYAVS